MKKTLGIGYLIINALIILTALFFLYKVARGDETESKDVGQSQMDNRIAVYIEKLEQDPDHYEALKALGIAYSKKARTDFKKYTPKAVECLTRAYEMDKTDYETMCYLGSTTTMMANTTRNPFKKMSYVNKGTAQMDKAVRKDPDNISVRLTRAFNSKSLPEFLNRGHIAIEDFEYLATLIDKNPNIRQDTKKTVYGNLVELYEKAGNEEKKKHFQRLLDNIN
jgi:cytochrome c-type biogenesis protein CcmH/NrfG